MTQTTRTSQLFLINLLLAQSAKSQGSGDRVPRHAAHNVSPFLALRRSRSRSTVQAIRSNPMTMHDVPSV